MSDWAKIGVFVTAVGVIAAIVIGVIQIVLAYLALPRPAPLPLPIPTSNQSTPTQHLATAVVTLTPTAQVKETPVSTNEVRPATNIPTVPLPSAATASLPTTTQTTANNDSVAPTNTATPEVSTHITPSRTPTPSARTPVPDAEVRSAVVNMRSGPGTAYDLLGSYPQKTALTVIGRNATEDWLQVQAPDGKTGWMDRSLLQVNINPGQVLVAAVPPTPTPSAAPLTPTSASPASGDMAYVPAGEFLMGSLEGEGDDDERPQRTVYLDAFYIGRTEVTAAQYQRCVDAGACSTPGTGDACTFGVENKADHPINCVSWNQAVTYCSWAGGWLPTEAEWEKAARGTDGRIYPWGDSDPDCSRARFSGCQQMGEGVTVSVGRLPDGVSPYGALDMAGNMWEWVADWYYSGYYATAPNTNPKGPLNGQYHVYRGGSWTNTSSLLRAADRGEFPFYPYSDPNSWPNLGFRCAYSP